MYNSMNEIKEIINNCNRCKLCRERTNVVFEKGSETANVMFIGDVPSKEDDLNGIPFCGKNGFLIEKVLETIGFSVDNIYYTNIIKCRSGNNKNIDNREINQCIDFLRNQVILVKPKIIVLLGKIPIKTILGEEYVKNENRGILIEKKGIYYLPTYHPAELFRDETKKLEFLKDMKNLMKEGIIDE